MANQNLEKKWNGSLLKHNHTPKCSGITLDRTLRYKKHLYNISSKIQTRSNIRYKLCGTNLGAFADTFRCTAMGLVYKTEYGAGMTKQLSH